VKLKAKDEENFEGGERKMKKFIYVRILVVEFLSGNGN
jgi:hypothetical protein